MPSPEFSRRAVVTGLGAVTPIGNDHPTFWRNLVAGVSGAGPITSLRRERVRRAHRGRGQGLRPDDRHGPQDGAPDEPLHPPRHGRRQGGRRATPGSTSATGAPSDATASRSRSTPAAAAWSRSSTAPRCSSTRARIRSARSPIPALSGSMAACQLSMEYGADRAGHHPGRRVRELGHRLPRRLADDPARRGRRGPRGRLGGAAAADGLRGARQHGRAVEAQRRPDARLAAVRPRPRRLPVRRGRGGRGHRVRRARAGARRDHPGRGPGRRPDRRCVPHLGTRADRPRRGTAP